MTKQNVRIASVVMPVMIAMLLLFAGFIARRSK
jgi:hypothetical protein